MYHNRISDYLDESSTEYPTTGSVAGTPVPETQGPCLTSLGDVYEAARKRAILDCQIEALFHADDLLED